MTSSNIPGIAKSNYRQVRLTFTQEIGGRCSYSIHAKALNDDWKQQHCLVRDSVDLKYPVLSVEDVYSALLDILREQLLPGIG